METIVHEYDGSPELAALWQEYAGLFMEKAATPKDGTRALAALNRLAFKTDHIRNFIGNAKKGDAEYGKRLEDIKSTAALLCALSEDLHFRPLYEEVERQLVKQWIAIRNETGIIPGGLKTTRKLRAIEEKKRHDFGAKPEAFFLSTAIHELTPIIPLANYTLEESAKQRFSQNQIIQEANVLFMRALYAYKEGEGTKFHSYFTGSWLKGHLWINLNEKNTVAKKSVSFSAGDPDEKGELGDTIEDDKTRTSDEIADDNEQRLLIRQLVKQIEDPRDKQVILLRFGLNKDGIEHTLEEIAEILGVTKERIRQIETRTLDKLREALEKGVVPADSENEGKNPSFIHMLEKAFEQGKNFNEFLFGMVLPQLGKGESQPMPYKAFAELLSQSSANPSMSLTYYTIRNWERKKSRPDAKALQLLTDAFDLDTNHILMLHRMIRGRALDREQLQSSLAQASSSGEHSALLQELIKASGMSADSLYRLCGGNFRAALVKNSYIDDPEIAKRLLGLLLPYGLYTPPMSEEFKKAQAQILPMITGDPQSLGKAVEMAADAPYPPGKFLSLLTGEHGLIRLSNDELFEVVSTPQHPMTRDTIAHMRVSSQKSSQRIFEDQAERVLDKVAAMTGKYASPAMREKAITFLTEIESPSVLLEKCWQGEMSIGNMVKDIRARKGLFTPYIPHKKYIPVKGGKMVYISGLQQDAHPITPPNARLLAEAFGFTGEEIRKFTVLATWTDHSLSPDQILDHVLEGAMEKDVAMKRLISLTGREYSEFADVLGVNVTLVRQWLNKYKSITSADSLPKFADAVGLEHRQGDFTEAFASDWAKNIINRRHTADAKDIII